MMITKETRSSAFLRFGKKSESAELRLYTFAHAGGAASSYAPWSRMLAPHIDVIGIELPGHGTRVMEDPLTTVFEMAREISDAIEASEAGLQTPFAFYGHSLGAVVAFETSRLLMEQTGRSPEHLFTGAARAPHMPPIVPPISHLDEGAFLKAVQQRYGGIPAAVLNERELLEMILPALRSDFSAYEHYSYLAGVKLSCPVTAFVGSRDPIILEEAVAAWADHTSGPFRLQAVPGDHFFLSDCREQVLGVLSDALPGVLKPRLQRS